MGIFVLWPKVETSVEFFVENYLKLCYDQILKVSTASVFGNFLLKIGTDGIQEITSPTPPTIKIQDEAKSELALKQAYYEKNP